jgi:hypothetical protein
VATTNLSPQEQQAALRALANRLTLKARDYASEAKRSPAADPRAEYLRGLAEGYYKSAVELAEILKTGALSSAAAASSAPQSTAPTQPVPAVAAPEYESLTVNDVLQILMYVDATPRDVTPNKDGTFTAVFSRWQPLSDHERLDKIKSADGRIVIIGTGKTKDNSDPYVQFAFTKLLGT